MCVGVLHKCSTKAKCLRYIITCYLLMFRLSLTSIVTAIVHQSILGSHPCCCCCCCCLNPLMQCVVFTLICHLFVHGWLYIPSIPFISLPTHPFISSLNHLTCKYPFNPLLLQPTLSFVMLHALCTNILHLTQMNPQGCFEPSAWYPNDWVTDTPVLFLLVLNSPK